MQENAAEATSQPQIEISEADKRKEQLIALNTSENQAEVVKRLASLFEKLTPIEENQSRLWEAFSLLRTSHFEVYEEYIKVKNSQSQFNNNKKPSSHSEAGHDKPVNSKADRNIAKLHSTVKKKEINIDRINKLDSLSVSSAKNPKSVKSVDITPLTKKNRPDSHSVKAPELRSKLTKKEPKEKDTYLQTETDAQVPKKSKLGLSPSKSTTKSPLVKDENNERHKKTASDFKKNSTTKDLTKKQVNGEKTAEKAGEKDQKKNKEPKPAKEKTSDKNAAKNDKKPDKGKPNKNGEIPKGDKNGKNGKKPAAEKKKEEEKTEENHPNASETASQAEVKGDSVENPNPTDAHPEAGQTVVDPPKEGEQAVSAEVKV